MKWITLGHQQMYDLERFRKKACKIVPENGVRSCVHFCLRSLLRLDRCIFYSVQIFETYCLSPIIAPFSCMWVFETEILPHIAEQGLGL